MKRSPNTIKSLLTALSVILLVACGQGKPDYSARLAEYMQMFPESNLQDVYKWSFQDRFGIEHLLADTASVRNYLSYELTQMQEEENLCPDYYDTGMEGNFVRINLSLVQEGKLMQEDIVEAMFKSCEDFEMPSIEAWKAEWEGIVKVLRKDRPDLFLGSDKAQIDSCLAAGQYAFHHSERFGRAYHPHYRIIRKDIFENQLKPIMDGIIIHIRYTGENGSARAFAREMIESGTVAAIRAEEGNLKYEYSYPEDDPESVILTDIWTSQEALDIHHATPMMETIAALREKYNLHMTVDREGGVPDSDTKFIRD